MDFEGFNQGFFPVDMACNEHAYVVLDELAHCAYVWSGAQSKPKQVGFKGDGPGLFVYPTSICTDPEGCFYISDRYNHRVQKFSPDMQFLKMWGQYGSAQGQMKEPWGLACLDGKLFLSDRLEHRVSVFDLEGQFLYAFGNPGPTAEYYESSEFKKGFVYERWVRTSHKFSTVPMQFYFSDYEVGTLMYPRAVLAGLDELYVADAGNRRIQVFNPKGTVINSLPLPEGFVPHHMSWHAQELRVCGESELYYVCFASPQSKDFQRRPLEQTLSAMRQIQGKSYALNSWEGLICEQ